MILFFAHEDNGSKVYDMVKYLMHEGLSYSNPEFYKHNRGNQSYPGYLQYRQQIKRFKDGSPSYTRCFRYERAKYNKRNCTFERCIGKRRSAAASVQTANQMEK